MMVMIGGGEVGGGMGRIGVGGAVMRIGGVEVVVVVEGGVVSMITMRRREEGHGIMIEVEVEEVDTMITAEVVEGGGGTSMTGVEVVEVEEGGGIIRDHGRGQGRGRGAATGVVPHRRRRGVWIGHRHQGGRVRRRRRVRVVLLLMAPRKPHQSPQLCVRLLRAFAPRVVCARAPVDRPMMYEKGRKTLLLLLHTMMNTLYSIRGGYALRRPHTHSALTVRARVLLWCGPSSRVLCLAVRATGRHNADTHTRRRRRHGRQVSLRRTHATYARSVLVECACCILESAVVV